ncbi:MAG: dihydrodipicolinate synthase family protein, partial [Proteobacteria bacterium]|nr:dihydrodipicolinate synthase family protein [Pseudomonadota bacterium]
MRNNNRLFLTLSALLALGLAGCGGGGGSAGGGGGTDAEEALGDVDLAGVEVEIAGVWTGTEQERFRAVLDAAQLPMIVYNVPGRTSCNILPETVEALAVDPRVVGVKEASGDIVQISEFARRVGVRVAIYSGNDDQIVPVLSLGGR